MMTIFTRDYSHRLRHSDKKQNNNTVKTETIENTAEVTRFDNWFASSYTKLREKIRFFFMVVRGEKRCVSKFGRSENI